MVNKKRNIQFVDVRKYRFVAEPRYYFYGWMKSSIVLGRISAVQTLMKARSYLPKGYNFKIWDCRRSYKTQAIMIQSFKKRLQLARPELSKKNLKKAVFIFAGPLLKKIQRLDTHRNGGSFDLTVINKKSEELYMGTDHDDLTIKAATDYFEKKKSLSAIETEARKNRRILNKAMTKAGFINYTPEWWHWSYGK